MNAVDVLKYGNQTFLSTLQGLPDPGEPGARQVWEEGGVGGVWSVKNIVSHLASHEHVLVDVLYSFLDHRTTPYLTEYCTTGPAEFNNQQVDKRRHMSPSEALAEYKETYGEVATLIPRIPADRVREPGTLPWYGREACSKSETYY
jgi:hypothetical protein